MRNKDREEAVISVQQSTGQSSPSEASFSLGGSAVWVGDESGIDVGSGEGEDDSIISFVGTTVNEPIRRRRSTDASSGSSQVHLKDGLLRPSMIHTPSYYDPTQRSGMAKDTHFYHTTVAYKDYQLPIKMPLATFPEEVGDVGFFVPVGPMLMAFVQVFAHHPHQGLLQPGAGFRPAAPPFAHERPTNTPHNNPLQCASDGEAHNISGAQEACGRSVKLRALGLRAWVRVRRGSPRLHRAFVPVRQLE
jgi:hypothetical protein